jgi:hypothetical protein
MTRSLKVGSHAIPLALSAVIVFPAVALRKNKIGLPSESCVAGKPLIATETLDYNPIGNTSDPLPLHREGMLYRDSKGRTRKELTYPGQPQWVFIQDCVAGVRYSWRVGDTEAVRSKIKHVAPVIEKTAASERVDNDEDSLLIEGTTTYHSRTEKETAGKIEELIESWYAPSLDLNLVFIFYHINEGKTTVRMSNINRVEPDATLFQVPEEMTIKDDVSPQPMKP